MYVYNLIYPLFSVLLFITLKFYIQQVFKCPYIEEKTIIRINYKCTWELHCMKFACMLKVFCLSLILVFTILIGTQFNATKEDIVHSCNQTEISHVDPKMFKRGIEIYTQLLQNYSNSESVRDDFEPENRICYLLEGMHRACEEVVTENCDASMISNKCGEREPDALAKCKSRET